MQFLRRHGRSILLGLGGVLLLAAGVLAYALWPVTEDLSALAKAGAGYQVRILRDTWGVPHIFGQTDADAAYGLAYAHAEDDFQTIQQMLLAARGQLARVYGSGAAPNDYLAQLLRVQAVVQAGYERDLSPDTRALVEAYAAGLNVYAAKHPKDALPGLFPVSGRDVVALSVHEAPLFFGLDKVVGDLFAKTRQQPVSERPTGQLESVLGSNAFAAGPARTTQGETFLAVNSHQPWTGPVAWYEAHVHSEQGWDMAGALFPGVPVIVHGHNRDLGWAFTVNHPDLVDVYVLEMNPANKNQYRYDGEWRDLEVGQAPITVKLFGRLTWTVKREVLWSVYGPTVRQPHGVYAVRYAGMGRVGIYEQLYRLNKARNFEEWQAGMRLGQLPMFNTVYADRTGNIDYLYNGLIPLRAAGYDWRKYLPGDSSAVLWTDYLPFDQLPQVFNPPSGVVVNANSTPYRATFGAGNPDPANYPASLGIETRMSNRALRLLDLFSAAERLTLEDFTRIKFDLAYAPESDVAKVVQILAAADFSADPDLTAAASLVRAWDLQTTADSPGATLVMLTLVDLYQTQGSLNPSMMTENTLDPAALRASFANAVKLLQKDFGRIEVPWGEVNRLRRGTVDLPLAGGPDTVRAVYGIPQADGRLSGMDGDSYVMLVSWDAAGQVSSSSIHQFGSATLDAASPHYADQAALFARQELKPVWLDEAEIRAHLEREYIP